MSLYEFETDQFGISDKALHLLRSRFNYETIEFSSIDHISIYRGRQVHNWFLLLLIGLLLSGLGLFTLVKLLYEYFFANNFTHFYVEHFAFPLLPLILGAFSIYFSLKSGFVLKLSVNNNIKQFPIGQLEKKSQIAELEDFFRNNSLTKHKFKLLNSTKKLPVM